MKSKDVRQSFLDFFEQRDHRVVQSSSLVPIDDPTLLFTNAGMNQFKLTFTGNEKRPYKRATSSQKCIRAGGKHNDLENVGQTARHHTFFEMLGNFSFGDYFKAEAIEFAWDYVTNVLKLPKDRFWATVFEDDDEAFELWEKIVPELKGRVLRFDEKENYWSMGDTGPCGPCSELHFDRGEQHGTGPEDKVNGETDRFVEIWNLVFMQFEKDEDGNRTPLPKPSVDTGAGLERIVCVLQDGKTNYDTDLFIPIIESIENLCGRKYKAGAEGTSFRVIADHIRALTFAFADGAVPSNEGRGYVLRRILRRAARHGRLLGMNEPFLYKLVPVVRQIMSEAYPELESREIHVTELIRVEGERFNETLDKGLELFDRVAKKISASGGDTIPGDEVFKLCDTYGFPPDLTEVMARERNLKVDSDGFECCMAEQQNRSKEARGQVRFILSSYEEKSDFEGYDNDSLSDCTVLKVTPAQEDMYEVLLDKTPFYAEAGGQVGDAGTLTSENMHFEVIDTQKSGEAYLHVGRNVDGDIGSYINKTVTAAVDATRRIAIKRNHTATHLLHKALRDVLGEHVQQAGSSVAPDRFRFDFSHFKAVSRDDLEEIERRVNEMIMADHEVRGKEMSLEKAKAAGAMALFGEKYGDEVRMVEVEGFSRELCGGTHVSSTGEIGMFTITHESAIAAGMRRMEAVTGGNAYRLFAEYRENVGRIAGTLKSKPSEIAERVEILSTKLKEQQKELARIRQAQTDESAKSKLDGMQEYRGIHFLAVEVEDRKEAQQYLDNVKNDERNVLVGIKHGTNYFATASGVAIDNGYSANEAISWFNEAFKGRGGGRDVFAQGGTKEDFSFEDFADYFSKRVKKKVEESQQ